MERYLRTDGAVLFGVHVAYASLSHYAFAAYGDDGFTTGDGLRLIVRFLQTSAMWYYIKMTWMFWLNYLFFTSYTTVEFVRLVVKTFAITCLHEFLGGGRTNGQGFFPFPFEACTWTTKGVENWKAQDPTSYAASGSPQPGDFVEARQRFWGWKRPPMWHLVISMDVFCTVSNPAQPHEYQNYCSKLNSGLPAMLPSLIRHARHVTSNTFSPATPVDVSAKATCAYKVFDVGADLADRLHKAMESGQLAVGVKVDVSLVDELMHVVCQHVTRAGKPVSVSDCVAMHLNTGTSGPYIPVLHWDVEYGLFPEADGFNVWMLTSSDNSEGNEGNIYIVECAPIPSSMPASVCARICPACSPGTAFEPFRSSSKITGEDMLPEWLAFTGPALAGQQGISGKTERPAVVRRLHDLCFPERETASYATVDELNLKFDYIAAKPGECVVWSKR